MLNPGQYLNQTWISASLQISGEAFIATRCWFYFSWRTVISNEHKYSIHFGNKRYPQMYLDGYRWRLNSLYTFWFVFYQSYALADLSAKYLKFLLYK